MERTEIINLVKQIKQVAPTLQVPEVDKMKDEDKVLALSAYINAFTNLNYVITIRALTKIQKDEKTFKQFLEAPISVLMRETIKLTEFTKDEKERHKNSQQHIFTVDRIHKMMLAVNKANTSIAMHEFDRPMSPLEEDYWVNDLMTTEEYKYLKGISSKKPNQDIMYNPRTRTRESVELTKLQKKFDEARKEYA